MRIAGMLSNSFVDYPAHIAAVVFTPGCNMDCWYCHNRHILKSHGIMDENKVLEFLHARKNFLDGVVLTGGEPLLQEDAAAFIRKLRDTGLLVKLDTNGSYPKALEDIIREGLVDYIAMDLRRRMIFMNVLRRFSTYRRSGARSGSSWAAKWTMNSAPPSRPV